MFILFFIIIIVLLSILSGGFAMNLLTDAWLPMRLSDGSVATLPLSSIVREEVVDFSMPRLDFQSAAHQFAIAVLQTVYAPTDNDAWFDVFESPPTTSALQSRLNLAAHAFVSHGDGACFMQDLDPLLSVKSTSPISGLLIDAPGGNTLKENKDLFIKRDMVRRLSLPMAMMALFTLQINAPSGGQGHRTGLRGGGPMTTLLRPNTPLSPLWQKLWLNVLSRSHWHYDDPDLQSAAIFPWLGETRSSKGNVNGIFAEDVHPLTLYWATPRRIRLMVEAQSDLCDLSGERVDEVVSAYCTLNYGNNYEGDWRHPLTPYRRDPKKPTELPWSVKGQRGGITYKQWDILALIDDRPDSGHTPAEVVKQLHNLQVEEPDLLPGVRVWAFAYDMDNMKARGIYTHEMPYYFIPMDNYASFVGDINELQSMAVESISMVKAKIKAAWFGRPKDVKGDLSSVETTFWQRTESLFFETVNAMLLPAADYRLSPAAARRWRLQLVRTCEAIFDQYAVAHHRDALLTQVAYSKRSEPVGMGRAVHQRIALKNWLQYAKVMKKFKTDYELSVEVAHE